MKITLRKLSLPKQPDKVSLYLDITGGPKRIKQYLGIQIFKQPKTAAERIHNVNNLELANRVRIQREHELQISKFGFTETNYDADFLEYLTKFSDTWEKKNYKMFHAVLVQFTDFLAKKGMTRITGHQVTLLLCEDFAEYLKKHLNYSSPYDYFKKFKQVLKRAKKEKIINIELDDLEVSFKFDKDAIRKQILTSDEIIKLANTRTTQPVISNAFLFCLNTGIDYATVSTITWDNIKGDYLEFERSKTEKVNRIKLNTNALSVLPERGTGLIYDLPSWTMCIKSIRKWAKRAGINKKITWHTARHSMGSMMINKLNVNIRVVQDLLGHGDIKHTMRYTKSNTEAKDNAIDSMPELKRADIAADSL